MTDGTTGIQVAPITEDDMNKVRSILQRAADAIVGASQMADDIAAMKAELAQLRDDADRYRRNAEALEESLSNARVRRQELEGQLSTAIHAQAAAERERDDMTYRERNGREAAAKLETELSQVKHERDDAQLRVMELEDQLKAHASKLDAIHKALGVAPEQIIPPAPIVRSGFVEVPPAPAAEPEPVPAAASQAAEPTPLTEEERAHFAEHGTLPPKPTRHYLDGWALGALWDPDANGGRGGYYTEDLPF